MSEVSDCADPKAGAARARERGTRLARAPGSSRRGRPSATRSGEITAEVLRAAGRSFFERGFDETSMEGIARSVGVPKTTLYKRYADKHDLLRAVITERMQDWASHNAQSDADLPETLAERLTQYLTTILVWATKPEVRAINRLAANLPETHGQELSGRSLWGYENVQRTIADTVRSLGPAAGIDARNPDRVAESLLALVRGWLVGRTSIEQVGRGEAEDAAEWFVSLVMRGSAAW